VMICSPAIFIWYLPGFFMYSFSCFPYIYPTILATITILMKKGIEVNESDCIKRPDACFASGL
jgi:hypothetical protein